MEEAAGSPPPASALRSLEEVAPASADPVVEAVRAFQRGAEREASFGLLMAEYGRLVEGFFRRRGCTPEEVADLRQQSFLRVWETLADLRQPEEFRSWLFRIVKTTWLRHLRGAAARKRSAETVPLESLAESGAEPGRPPGQLEDLERREHSDALRAAVAALPPQERRCLVLQVYQERSLEEIATLLRLSVGTVKAHLFHAREKLRARLTAQPHELATP